MNHSHERSPPAREEHARKHSPARPERAAKNPVLASRGISMDGLGNRAVLSLAGSRTAQRKARVSQPGDPLEREADRAADAVVSAAGPAKALGDGSVLSADPSAQTEVSVPHRHVAGDRDIHRMPTDDEELASALGLGSTEKMPEPETSAGASEVGPLFGGQSLDERTRSTMESRFGESFGDVRIHSGPDAGDAADALRSRAFTVGDDIVFAAGEFAPETTEGQRLLAHELAHVVQQRGPLGPSPAGEKETERDAHKAADEMERGGTPRVHERAERGTVQKEPKEDSMKSAPVLAWSGVDIEGSVAIYAREPGRIDQETVGFLHGGPGQMNVYAYEHGGDSGHDTLTVSIGIAGTVSQKDPSPTTRWPKIELHIYQIAPQQPEPDEPDQPELPKPKPKPKVPNPIPKPNVPKMAPKPALPQPAPKQTPPEPDPQQAPPITIDPLPHQLSPADEVKRSLSQDPTEAARLAPKMSDSDFVMLSPAERSKLLWALANNPADGGLDMSTVGRLFQNTPDREVGPLQRELNANDGALQRVLSQQAKGDSAKQFGDAMMNLWVRALTFGPAAGGNPDWMNGPLLLDGAPKLGPPDALPVKWLGDPPSWAKDMTVKIDPRGNWTVFTKDSDPLRIEGALDRTLRAERQELDAARRRARSLPLALRVPRMKALAENKWTGSDSEEEILEMIEHPDDFEKKQLLDSLDSATSKGKSLIDALDDVVDGENNFRLHVALSKLRMSQMKDDEVTKGVTNAMVLPWHDTKVNAPANFFVTRLADGRIQVKMSMLQVIDLKESEDYSGEAKKLPLDLYTGDGMVFDPNTPVVVHDYDSNQNVVLLARDLEGYQHKGTRKFVGDTADVATFALPVAGGGRAAITAGAVLWDVGTAGTIIADEYRVEIRKNHPELLTMLDTAKMVIAARGVASLVRSSPEFITKWREMYQTFKGRRAMAAFAAESGTAAKAISALEHDTDAIFAQIGREGAAANDNAFDPSHNPGRPITGNEPWLKNTHANDNAVPWGSNPAQQGLPMQQADTPLASGDYQWGAPRIGPERPVATAGAPPGWLPPPPPAPPFFRRGFNDVTGNAFAEAEVDVAALQSPNVRQSTQTALPSDVENANPAVLGMDRAHVISDGIVHIARKNVPLGYMERSVNRGQWAAFEKRLRGLLAEVYVGAGEKVFITAEWKPVTPESLRIQEVSYSVKIGDVAPSGVIRANRRFEFTLTITPAGDVRFIPY